MSENGVLNSVFSLAKGAGQAMQEKMKEQNMRHGESFKAFQQKG
jgi:hypothetical protein